MMRSLYAGVSGLKNHQLRMDVIGNNIANVNTPGYKKSRVLFQDIFSQTMRNGSGAQGNRGGINPAQIGLGVTLGAVEVMPTQGAIQPTSKTTDLSIEGEGYFVLDGSNPGEKLYTRVGAFDFDDTGTLTGINGSKVMGWALDPATGKIDTSKLTDLVIPRDLFLDPKATSGLQFTGNLKADAPTGTTYQAFKTAYDSVGQPHEMEILFTKTANNSWNYQVSLSQDDPLIQQHLVKYFPNFNNLSREAQWGALQAAEAAVLEPDAVASSVGTANAKLPQAPTPASAKFFSNNLIISAAAGGTAGNDIKVSVVQGTAANTTATVVGREVIVSLGTGAGNATLQKVADAINMGPAAGIVTAKVVAGTGANVASPVTATPLTGGYPASSLNITAKTSGLTGNDITVQFNKAGAASQPTAVAISGNDITVTLGTDANGDISATLKDVVDAINASPAASALVQAAVDKTDEGRLAQSVDKIWLQGGFLAGLDIQAAFGGTNGNKISIETVKGNSGGTAIAVNGQQITVYLQTDGSGNIVANLEDIAKAINSDEAASTLLKVWVDPANAADLASVTSRTALSGGADSTTQPRTGSLIFDQAGKILVDDTRLANGAEEGQLTKALSFDPDDPDAKRVTITPDFANLTQFAAASSAVVDNQDGNPPGGLETISINDSGAIVGSFSGGIRRELGRIALASFTNPAGLARVGENIYQDSGSSGDPRIGEALSAERGKVVSSSLEMSNVDLAEELTDMIITQRGFQANSRIITTSDELLQELVNLKR
ncbi:MAG: flagellar hook-basal body complex protein [Bacillota bacterium]